MSLDDERTDEERARGRQRPSTRLPPSGLSTGIRPDAGFGAPRNERDGEFSDTLLRIARARVTLTLYGETGTGKDRLARILHENGPQASGPFVVLDCAAVVGSLAESELFGHTKGSFTGAVQRHVGAFERANGGTLFMDEIGELPLELQPRLLRALENWEIRPVGGGQAQPLAVRVIAATHRDLWREVLAGRFRADLYYRLCVLVLEVPPLRSRLCELPEIVRSILLDLGRPDLTVAPSTYAHLRKRSWPGNIRELKNTLNFAVAFCDGPVLLPEHVKPMHPADVDVSRLRLDRYSLRQIEAAAIAQTLAQVGGSKSKAAESLEIALSTLYEKMKRHGIE